VIVYKARDKWCKLKTIFQRYCPCTVFRSQSRRRFTL